MQPISSQEAARPRMAARVCSSACVPRSRCWMCCSFWTQTLDRGTSIFACAADAFAGGCRGAAFVLSDRRRAYLILCGVLAVFWGAHMLACRRVGYANPVSDLTNFIRVAQLPVYTFSLITLFRRTPRFLDVLEDACTINLYLIAAVTLVSVLTGTCMPTYAKFRIGWCGWFWLPNSQSAILGVLTVIAMLAAVRRGKLPAAVMHCIVGFALLFLLGTRLAYAEIFGIAAGVCLSMALTRQWNVRALAVVLLCAALCGGLYHQSPMYRNRQAYAESVSEQQQAAEDLGASEQETRDALYWKYQRVAVERFGLENVEHAFHDSTDISVIGDIRLTKLVYCRLLMAELPATSRLFGFELDATRCQGAIFDAENDFHGVYYLYGLTGLVLLAGFLLFFRRACAVAHGARAAPVPHAAGVRVRHGGGNPDRQRLLLCQRSPAAERLVLPLRCAGCTLLPDGT